MFETNESKRRKAVEAIVDALGPVVRFSAAQRGLNRWPPGYWDDPFVLGFLVGCATQLGVMRSAGKLPGGQVPIWIEAFDQLTDGHGELVIGRTREFREARDSDFARGMGHAGMCVSYAYGVEDFPGDPSVAKAKKAGSTYTNVLGCSDRKDPERTKTAGALLHIMFHEVVAQRLNA